MNRAWMCAAMLAGIGLWACGSDEPKNADHQNEVTAADSGATADAGASVQRDASTRPPSTDPIKTPETPCAKVMCKGAAKCVGESTAAAHCECPSGYRDVRGDASQCDDKDECADDSTCAKQAKCENTPGSYKCTCPAPAYEGDGKSCKCAAGYAEHDGLCLANDGGKCEDNLDCVNGHCEGGSCCAQACDRPGAQCLTTKGATCEDGHTCKYAVAPDGDACEDSDSCTSADQCKNGSCVAGTKSLDCNDNNPCTDDSCDSALGCMYKNNAGSCDDANACTTADHCAEGVCAGAAKTCAAEADGCNSGACDPADGSCRKQPVADGALCDDASSCSPMDQCMAGQCVGQGNACGPNATACTPGTPNTCSCAANYRESAGLCIPNDDECASNPCSPNATCFDPSTAPNTVTCSCKPGFSGDGRQCTAVDTCANNPCGEGLGTCAAASGGAYTCSCNAGYKSVLGKCVCDLNGTFAVRQRMELFWTNVDSIEDGTTGSDTWGIQRFKYDDQGNLEMEMVACGETNVELCGTGFASIIPTEAYLPYLPVHIWGKPNLPISRLKTSLPNARPNSPFNMPPFAVTIGISLADPLGAWPATQRDVQGASQFDGSAVNDARWQDSDADNLIGATYFSVGPGGVTIDGVAPDPIQNYGAISSVCPRGNPNATRYAYNYLPAAEGLTVRRIKRVFQANRTISKFEGKLDSCEHMSGDIKGQDGGANIVIDARIGGCVRVEGSGETACSTTAINFLDGESTTQLGRNGHFVMRRIADDATCEQVRALQYD